MSRSLPSTMTSSPTCKLSASTKTPVTVLFNWQDRVVVDAESLQVGDEVIVEGNERLMPGATLAQAQDN